MFEKVLIANRGEIAIRVARTLKEMGIGSVAVYSEIDRDAPHVREADEAFLIGPAVPAESYLDIDKIIETAKQAGAEAIHPGYGFLAENADFAKACAEAGIVFIGPPPEAIEAMGSKTRAREIMAEAGVPIVPGATEPAKDLDAARKQAEEAGYPVACKAAGGGGGKGFRVAMTPRRARGGLRGRGPRRREVLLRRPRLRRALPGGPAPRRGPGARRLPRQRDPPRRARLLDPAPPPEGDRGGAGPPRRRRDARADRQDRHRRRGRGRLPRRRHGRGHAGRRGVLLPRDEHPGPGRALRDRDGHRRSTSSASRSWSPPARPLSISQEDVELRGHAIECRINAEAAHKKFAPAPGAITTYREPAGPGVRVDSGVEAGSEVTPMYDPMVAKLIVWDVDREHATRRMLRALGEYEVGGLTTLIPFHEAILATEQWANGETCRDLMEDEDWLKSTAPGQAPAPAEGEEAAPQVARDYKVEVSGKLFDVKVIGEPVAGIAPAAGGGGRRPPKRERKSGGGPSASSEALPSPLQGTVFKVAVEKGAEVSEGDLICVIEAMKMENEITAHRSGKVEELNVAEGASVSSGDVLAVIK